MTIRAGRTPLATDRDRLPPATSEHLEQPCWSDPAKSLTGCLDYYPEGLCRSPREERWVGAAPLEVADLIRATSMSFSPASATGTRGSADKKVIDGLSQHFLRPETSVPQRLPAEQGACPRGRFVSFPEEKALFRCAL